MDEEPNFDSGAYIPITLNPAGVTTHTHKSVFLASRAVQVFLQHLGEHDFNVVPQSAIGIGYSFQDSQVSDTEMRQMLESWVLSRAFHDLARGVRESLEEAELYIFCLKYIGRPISLIEFNNDTAIFKRKVQMKKFPDLMLSVNQNLTESLAFEKEFLSLQKVRNCLEHRRGVVGLSDVHNGNLDLHFPRIRLFYRRGEVEIELAPGEVLDTHEPGVRSPDSGEVPIYLQRTTRTISYAVGEKIEISADQFFEIAMGCFMFADDLAKKLPVPSVGET